MGHIDRFCPDQVIQNEVGVLEATVSQVEGVDTPTYFLNTLTGSLLVCQRAASCLLLPQRGDRVAVLVTETKKAYVIAVLEAQHPENGVLRLPETTTIEAVHVQMLTATITVAAKAIQLTAGQMKWVADAMHTVANRITQYCQNYLRTTQGLDQIQAQQLDLKAEQLIQLRADYVVTEAKNLVKTRSSQIHLG
jgi:Protein of unknown function (DUF3540)